MRSRPVATSGASSPKTSISAPSSTVTSTRRGSAARPASTSMASRVSSALPATEASGASMSVINATVGRPAPRATATRLSASSRAASSEGRKAPEPTLTSRTRPVSPAASFFDRIEGVMRSSVSTVAVTSRIA